MSLPATFRTFWGTRRMASLAPAVIHAPVVGHHRVDARFITVSIQLAVEDALTPGEGSRVHRGPFLDVPRSDLQPAHRGLPLGRNAQPEMIGEASHELAGRRQQFFIPDVEPVRVLGPVVFGLVRRESVAHVFGGDSAAPRVRSPCWQSTEGCRESRGSAGSRAGWGSRRRFEKAAPTGHPISPPSNPCPWHTRRTRRRSGPDPLPIGFATD